MAIVATVPLSESDRLRHSDQSFVSLPQENVVPPAKKAAAKKSTATPAKSAVQATITLKHLAAALARSHEIAKKQAEAMLGDLVTLTTRHLKKGNKIRLTGLGILQVRKRAARMGRNAATGATIKIKASKKIASGPPGN